jgi:hypothetical protein
VIDAVASDYQDSIKFVAVAGRSDVLPTEERAAELLTDNVAWSRNDFVWDLYEIRGQPASVIITGDDIVVDSWYGVLGEEALREQLDLLASI